MPREIKLLLGVIGCFLFSVVIFVIAMKRYEINDKMVTTTITGVVEVSPEGKVTPVPVVPVHTNTQGGGYIRTYHHNGHYYDVWNNIDSGTMIHSPACSCHTSLKSFHHEKK